MPIESKKFGDGQSTSNTKRGCSFQTYDNGCGWTNKTYISSRSYILFVYCGFMYEMVRSIRTELFKSESSVRRVKNLFMDVGVPSVITSDQGTNFTSSLTKEFLKMFGVMPRFNTPGHPESSGIVERWNQTFKKMIHHVIID